MAAEDLQKEHQWKDDLDVMLHTFTSCKQSHTGGRNKAVKAVWPGHVFNQSFIG